jgi:hypothetical protein
MKRILSGVLPVLLLASGLACKKEPPPPTPAPITLAPPTTTLPAPVGVGGVTLGKALASDKRVSAPTDIFGAKDTIYASVETTGTGHAKLRALWTFIRGGKTEKVDETTIEFDAAGPAVNEFHVSKPSGWPKGDYMVEIFLNDSPAPAATKAFKVA